MLAKFQAAWNKFWFAPVSPAPVCLFRILLGILALVDGLLWCPDFLTWYGNDAVLSYESLRYFDNGFSVLLLHHFSDQQIYGLLALYLIACVFVIVGFCSRTSLFLLWLLSVSISHRDPPIWHQASLLVRLYSFTMIFAPSAAMYSVDAWIKKFRAQSEKSKLYAPFAQRLLQFQVTCIYWRAFFGKIQGGTWLNGTAVYWTLHHTNVVRHTVPAFFDHLWFYNIMTYYTLVIEFLMWTIIWVPPFNKAVLLGALFLHGGIEWFVNLDLLEWAVVISYVLFLVPEDIERFMLKVGRLLPRSN